MGRSRELGKVFGDKKGMGVAQEFDNGALRKQVSELTNIAQMLIFINQMCSDTALDHRPGGLLGHAPGLWGPANFIMLAKRRIASIACLGNNRATHIPIVCRYCSSRGALQTFVALATILQNTKMHIAEIPK